MKKSMRFTKTFIVPAVIAALVGAFVIVTPKNSKAAVGGMGTAVSQNFSSDGTLTGTMTSTGVMTSTNTIYTAPFPVKQWGAASMQFIWASGSSPVGTLTMDISLDGTNWSDSGLTFTAISGNTGNRVVDITKTGVVWVRFKYVNASGSATASCKVYGKDQ